MNDPLRLLELNPAIRELVGANQRDRAPADVRARVFAVVAVALGTTVTSSALGGLAGGGGAAGSGGLASGGAVGTGSIAGSSLAGSLGGAVGKAVLGGTVQAFAVKAVSGMVLVGLSAYGAARLVESPTTPMDPNPFERSPATLVRESAPEPRRSVTGPVSPHVEEPRERLPESARAATPRAPARTLRVRSHAGRTPSKSPDPPPVTSTPRVAAPEGLSAELELIRRARTLARSGDAASAGKTLEEYRSRFPNGKLTPEAEQLEASLVE